MSLLSLKLLLAWPRTRNGQVALGLAGIGILAVTALVWWLPLPDRTTTSIYVIIASVLLTIIAIEAFLVFELCKQLEAERRSGERGRTFQTLFNITRGGLALLDPSGRFLDVNPSCTPLFGFERAELLAMSIGDVNIAPEAKLSGPLGLIGEQGSGVVEGTCRHKDGRLVHVEMTSALIPSSGGQLFVIFRDITGRKNAEETRARLEAQLRQSQKLEAIGTLASGIAHDFNNILGAILGNIELALHEIDAANPALTSLHEIRKAGQRAKELIRRIVAFARPQDNQTRPLNLPPVVEDAMKLVRATLPATVEITCSFASDVPRVIIDDSQISQVLLNLCANAYQAMDHHKGRIEVTVDVCEVPADAGQLNGDLRAGKYVCLNVHDTGRGVDRAIAERIFEPFFTTKAVGEGTGLGLSIVHSIARGHGGAVTLDSQPGEGATFHVYLPAVNVDECTETAEPATPVLPVETFQGARQHILYVDDEEPLVFLTKRLLERLGYRVSGFTDASAALSHFLNNSSDFDLLITDQSMPGMSGTDLAREVLSVKPEAQIMLVSGYLRPREVEQARALGIQEVILKPNTVDELAAAVHRLLSSHAVMGMVNG